MWPGRPLKVGEPVEEHTTLLDAKSSRGGGEMVLVLAEKQFRGERGLSVVDQR